MLNRLRPLVVITFYESSEKKERFLDSQASWMSTFVNLIESSLIWCSVLVSLKIQKYELWWLNKKTWETNIPILCSYLAEITKHLKMYKNIVFDLQLQDLFFLEFVLSWTLKFLNICSWCDNSHCWKYNEKQYLSCTNFLSYLFVSLNSVRFIQSPLNHGQRFLGATNFRANHEVQIRGL